MAFNSIIRRFSSSHTSSSSTYNSEEEEASRIQELLHWEEPPGGDLHKRLLYFLTGYSKEGLPVWVITFGRWDLRSVVEEGRTNLEDCDKYCEQMIRRIKQSAKDLQSPSENVIILVDLLGYSGRQITNFKVIQRVFRMAHHFVSAFGKEGLQKTYIVNSNKIFLSLYTLLKPILGKLTDLLELHGMNSDEWKNILLDKIQGEQLPQFLGGSKPDPELLSMVPKGGESDNSDMSPPQKSRHHSLFTLRR